MVALALRCEKQAVAEFLAASGANLDLADNHVR
jgi:hypothetical protein